MLAANFCDAVKYRPIGPSRDRNLAMHPEFRSSLTMDDTHTMSPLTEG
jgi:hypothetical protein